MSRRKAQRLPGFEFARVHVADEVLWQVQQDGRVLGTIAEDGARYIATRVIDGAAQTKRFANRDAAARWLARLAPII